jgi:hypothetical protein
MRKIHVIGGGLVGSMMMQFLHHAGYEFTWYDKATRINAWNACTGSVCPESSDPPNLFLRWNALAPKWIHMTKREDVPYFQMKNGAWIQNGTSIHVDVRRFVTNTQLAFATLRVEKLPEGSFPILTVGHMQTSVYWWGWSQTAKISGLDMRACFHKRVVRQSRYIYPKPDSDEYFIGSSIQMQHQPHSLDVAKHFDWWKRDWDQHGPELTITPTSGFREGWRPVGLMPGDWETIGAIPKEIRILPMSASGVKYSPLVCHDIVAKLKEIL